MARRYVPNRGNAVWLSFDPRVGHEQAGRRPAVVLSPAAYNGKVGLAILCPITNQVKGYPFEVGIPPECKVGGVVLADQAKSLDWHVRKAEFICALPHDLFHEQKVHALLVSLKDEENTYYTTILQNLFFATLNTEMDQPGKPPTRRFIKETKDDEGSEDHMVHQVWRQAKPIRDRTTFEQLLRSMPFLNGGTPQVQSVFFRP